MRLINNINPLGLLRSPSNFTFHFHTKSENHTGLSSGAKTAKLILFCKDRQYNIHGKYNPHSMTEIPGIPRIANGQAATSRMETLRYNYLCQHIQWPAIVEIPTYTGADQSFVPTIWPQPRLISPMYVRERFMNYSVIEIYYEI